MSQRKKIIFLVRKNLDQMMLDRDNVLIQEESDYNPDLTLEEYLNRKDTYAEEGLNSVYSGPDKPGGKKMIKTYIVFIPTEYSGGKKYLVKFTENLRIFSKTKKNTELNELGIDFSTV